MTPDEISELKELIEFLKENGIGEFEHEHGDKKVRIKFGHSPQGGAPSALDLARLGQYLNPGAASSSGGQGIHAVESAATASGAAESAGVAELHDLVRVSLDDDQPGRLAVDVDDIDDLFALDEITKGRGAEVEPLRLDAGYDAWKGRGDAADLDAELAADLGQQFLFDAGQGGVVRSIEIIGWLVGITGGADETRIADTLRQHLTDLRIDLAGYRKRRRESEQ